jgi:hypothetical protein
MVAAGMGKVRPDAARSHVDPVTVGEFAAFLEHCGGFEIL